MLNVIITFFFKKKDKFNAGFAYGLHLESHTKKNIIKTYFSEYKAANILYWYDSKNQNFLGFRFIPSKSTRNRNVVSIKKVDYEYSQSIFIFVTSEEGIQLSGGQTNVYAQNGYRIRFFLVKRFVKISWSCECLKELVEQ